MEAVVAKAPSGQRVDVGGRDVGSEAAELAESGVVEDDGDTFGAPRAVSTRGSVDGASRTVSPAGTSLLMVAPSARWHRAWDNATPARAR